MNPVYISKVLERCELLLNQLPSDERESWSIQKLTEQDFSNSHKTLMSTLQGARAGHASADAAIKTLQKKGRLYKLFNKHEITTAESHVETTKGALTKWQNNLQTALTAYAADPVSKQRVTDLKIKLQDQKNKRERVEKLRKSVQRAKEELVQLGARHGDISALVKFPVYAGFSGDAAEVSDINATIQYAISRVHDDLPMFAARRIATRQAQEIMDALQEQAGQSVPPADFSAKTAASLQTMAALPCPSDIRDALTALTNPSNFTHEEAWLIFWSAVSASIEYGYRADDTAANEGPREGWWINEWHHAIKHWDRQSLQALGIAAGSFECAIFNLDDSTPETQTGSDVLFMCVVARANRSYCSVTGVQFKQNTPDSPSIDLTQTKGRQYDAIANIYLKTKGKCSELYALLRPVAQGLASVAAVRIQQTFVTRQGGRLSSTLAERRAAGHAASVEWGMHGESLPTALATTLTNATNAYATLDDALTWFETNGMSELPRYIVIQVVSERPYSLTHDIKRIEQSGRYHHIAEYVRTRKLEPKTPGMDGPSYDM